MGNKSLETGRAWRAKNKERLRAQEKARALVRWSKPEEVEKRRARHWVKVYGVGADFIHTLFEMQGRACAVCRAPMAFGKHLHVDHDHETKQVRGLLCRPCNQTEGHIRGAKLSPTAFAQRLEEYLANPPALIVVLA